MRFVVTTKWFLWDYCGWVPSVNSGNRPITRWQNNNRHFTHFLRGWPKNRSRVCREDKNERLSRIIDKLNIKVEYIPLCASKGRPWGLQVATDSLVKLRRDEETKWAQGARVKHVRDIFMLIQMESDGRENIFQLQLFLACTCAPTSGARAEGQQLLLSL